VGELGVMEKGVVLSAIAGMALVTAVLRTSPVFLLQRESLPAYFKHWLHYVPVSVLSIMVIQELIIQQNQVHLSHQNLFLWTAIPSLIVAVKWKNPVGTLGVGIVVLALLRLFFGVAD
jgi:branched-subunit amino acid transport protein